MVLFALDRRDERWSKCASPPEARAPTAQPIVANYGYILSRAGRHQAAIEHSSGAQIDADLAPPGDSSPKHIGAPHGTSRLSRRRSRAVELQPDDPRLQLLLGNTLQTAGELEEAAAAYRRSIELDPDSFDAHNNLALTLLKMGEAREAARMYEEIRARWPQAARCPGQPGAGPAHARRFRGD